MLLEKWDYFREKIGSIVDFVSIAILMIWARVFLKVHTTTPKELLDAIENFLVPFDELYVEFRFYFDPSRRGLR